MTMVGWKIFLNDGTPIDNPEVRDEPSFADAGEVAIDEDLTAGGRRMAPLVARQVARHAISPFVFDQLSFDGGIITVLVEITAPPDIVGFYSVDLELQVVSPDGYAVEDPRR